MVVVHGPAEIAQSLPRHIFVPVEVGQYAVLHGEIATAVLRDLHGLEYDEIAKVTGTTLGTVKSRLSRARLALRKILEKNRELFS